jgi:hypothetical protein
MNPQSEALGARLKRLRECSTLEILTILKDPAYSPNDRVPAVLSVRNLDLNTNERLDLLISLLGDEAIGVVRGAIFELGELRDQRAILPLKALLSQNVPSGIRCQSLLSLAQLGDNSVILDCARLVNTGQKVERNLAATALAELGTAEALEVLSSYYDIEQESENRICAACLLASHKVGFVSDFLRTELNVAEDDLWRLMISVALSNIGDSEGIAALRDIAVDWNEAELETLALVIHRFAGLIFRPDTNIRSHVLDWVKAQEHEEKRGSAENGEENEREDKGRSS